MKPYGAQHHRLFSEQEHGALTARAVSSSSSSLSRQYAELSKSHHQSTLPVHHCISPCPLFKQRGNCAPLAWATAEVKQLPRSYLGIPDARRDITFSKGDISTAGKRCRAVAAWLLSPPCCLCCGEADTWMSMAERDPLAEQVPCAVLLQRERTSPPTIIPFGDDGESEIPQEELGWRGEAVPARKQDAVRTGSAVVVTDLVLTFLSPL